MSNNCLGDPAKEAPSSREKVKREEERAGRDEC
jgi:hypothetical protein